MRRVSKKRQALMKDATPMRRSLIDQVGKCEICGASPRHRRRGVPRELDQLCCHEIANGPLRAKAIDKPFAILVLCWYCNGHVVTNKAAWPEPRQLSVLRRSRPADYDLLAYNQLVNERAPNRITEADVDSYGGLRNEEN